MVLGLLYRGAAPTCCTRLSFSPSAPQPSYSSPWASAACPGRCWSSGWLSWAGSAGPCPTWPAPDSAQKFYMLD
jgi:hypothetical protein